MNIFNSMIMCVDASLKTTQDTAQSGDESFYVTMNNLINDFRDKYEVTEKDLGNADIWEHAGLNSDVSKDADKLNFDIMMVIWEHIKELMLECGVGEVAREVLAEEILDVETSWDRKNRDLGQIK